MYESVSGGGGVVHEDDRIQAGFVVDKDGLSLVDILHLSKRINDELNAWHLIRFINKGHSFLST